MTEAEGRAAVVAEALTWVGTPYHHGARLKGAGVDCAQLVAGIYGGAGVVEAWEVEPYPEQWHLHREAERLLRVILKYGHPIAWEALSDGDLILYKFGRTFSHAVIVTHMPQGIHAHLRSHAVVLTDLDRDSELASVPHLCFTYWPSDGR